MEYLIAVDLEGIGGVVGLPYETLNGAPEDYALAKENAILEINAAVRALFDSGADSVSVWDNHGAGKNLDYSKIDARAKNVNWRDYPYRLDFARDHSYRGIIYLGYHAREGTFDAILAHTYSSISVQYAKINGKPVGELDIDSYVAATHGIAPIFLASDRACVEQFSAVSPETVSVITKYGRGRNSAELRDEDEIVAEIYDGVCRAVKKDIPTLKIDTPFTLEVRYTRAEDAVKFYERAKNDDGVSSVKYGDDTHTLIFVIEETNRAPKLI